MEAQFWHNKWAKNEIGFHINAVNPLLAKHIAELNLVKGGRIFLPLCGKTLDIAWLLAQGYRVAGAELSELAIAQLFADLGRVPEVMQCDTLKRYRAESIDIFVGDIFALTATVLGRVDAIYDRAALVALPAEMRLRYAEHLRKLTNSAAQLLICFEYEQSLHEGPPFSIAGSEVAQHYQASYTIRHLDTVNVEGGLKGKCPALEQVWLLQS